MNKDLIFAGVAAFLLWKFLQQQNAASSPLPPLTSVPNGRIVPLTRGNYDYSGGGVYL